MRPALPIVVFVSLVGLRAPCASAQDTGQADATSSTAARALFNEGVELAERGEWPNAAERFHRAIALRDSAVIAYNLGTALAHLGHPVEAAERFRRVIRDASADASLRASATEELASVEPTIAWITIRVGGPSGALRVAIDGHPIHEALVGVAVPVDPSAHEISLLDADDAAAATSTVTLAEGERREVSIDAPATEVVAPEVAAPPLVAPIVPPPPSDDTWLWVGVGTGAAVLVAGVIITIVFVSTSGGPSAWSGNAGIIEARP